MLLTNSQERFCSNYARGMSGTAAYCSAYPNVSRKVAANSASLLLKRSEIQAEVERVRAETDRRSLFDMLRDSDYEALNLWLLGQLLGMLERPGLTVSETIRICAACGRHLAKMTKQRPGYECGLSPQWFDGLPGE